MTIKVGVFGAAGRMGATVCSAVHADPDLELVGGIDASGVGQSMAAVGGPDVDPELGSSVDDLVRAGAEVVVDFTIAPAARENLPKIADAGLHAVVGTTGFTDDDLAFRSVVDNARCRPVSFGIGDHDGLTSLHHRDDGVGRSKVDSDCLAHQNSSPCPPGS